MFWIDSIESASNPITRGEVDITLTSDASKQGWGAATSDFFFNPGLKSFYRLLFSSAMET